MKICICTTPLRPKPTGFPPFGSMAIIQALRSIGEETSFYHLDYHRYNRSQISEYFTSQQLELTSGYPYNIEDQDTLENLLSITEEEILFWERIGISPNYMFEEYEISDEFSS